MFSRDKNISIVEGSKEGSKDKFSLPKFLGGLVTAFSNLLGNTKFENLGYRDCKRILKESGYDPTMLLPRHIYKKKIKNIYHIPENEYENLIKSDIIKPCLLLVRKEDGLQLVLISESGEVQDISHTVTRSKPPIIEAEDSFVEKFRVDKLDANFIKKSGYNFGMISWLIAVIPDLKIYSIPKSENAGFFIKNSNIFRPCLLLVGEENHLRLVLINKIGKERDISDFMSKPSQNPGTNTTNRLQVPPFMEKNRD